jgi:hypothetical protein
MDELWERLTANVPPAKVAKNALLETRLFRKHGTHLIGIDRQKPSVASHSSLVRRSRSMPVAAL